MIRSRGILCLAALLPGLTACSTRLLQDAEAAQPRVEISRTPFFPQSDHQCGPAALATVLTDSGAAIAPEALTREIYVPGLKGSLQAELLTAARRHARVAYVVDPSLPGLLAELEQERPVLVLQNFGLHSWPLWHYAVVIGYDRERDVLLLRSGGSRRKQVAAARFLGTWRRAGYWGFIALRPGELPADDAAPRFLEAVDALDASGDHQVTAPAYEAAVHRWPAEPLGWFALGNNQFALARTDAAESAYREVLRLDPEYLPARNNLALLLARRGCRTAALATLEPAHTAMSAGPFAAELADSRREIEASTDSADSAADCAVPWH